jgi:hypothetical protein
VEVPQRLQLQVDRSLPLKRSGVMYSEASARQRWAQNRAAIASAIPPSSPIRSPDDYLGRFQNWRMPLRCNREIGQANEPLRLAPAAQPLTDFILRQPSPSGNYLAQFGDGHQRRKCSAINQFIQQPDEAVDYYAFLHCCCA